MHTSNVDPANAVCPILPYFFWFRHPSLMVKSFPGVVDGSPGHTWNVVYTHASTNEGMGGGGGRRGYAPDLQPSAVLVNTWSSDNGLTLCLFTVKAEGKQRFILSFLSFWCL